MVVDKYVDKFGIKYVLKIYKFCDKNGGDIEQPNTLLPNNECKHSKWYLGVSFGGIYNIQPS